MSNENTLGPLTAEEIRLVKEHREMVLKRSGWRQGLQAAINELDNFKPDGTVSLEISLSGLRGRLKNMMNNPKVY